MNDTTLTLIDILVKSTSLLLLGFSGMAFLRRHSAAQRSLAWLAIFAVMLVLPFAARLEPAWAVPIVVEHWDLPVATSDTAATEIMASEHLAMPPTPLTRSLGSRILEWTSVLYLAGIAGVLAIRWIGSLRLQQLGLNTLEPSERMMKIMLELQQRAGIARRIRLQMSGHIRVPMTWGTLRPVILLPASAMNESDANLRAALQHELTHIRHWDAASRWLATIVTAIWWPQPLVWLAARSWRLEQERACDDAVLLAGAEAAPYAEQLIAAARELRSGAFGCASALVMAMPSGLETRLRALMSIAQNRAPVGSVGKALALGLVIVLAASCTLFKAMPQERADWPGLSLTFLKPVAPTDFPRGGMVQFESRFVALKGKAAVLKNPLLDRAASGGLVIVTEAEKQQLEHILASTKGVDLMSTPRVTTRLGTPAKVEITREFNYTAAVKNDGVTPAQSKTKWLGIKVEFDPQSAPVDGKVAFRFTATCNEISGVMKGREITEAEFLERSTKGKGLSDFPPGKSPLSVPIFIERECSGSSMLSSEVWLLAQLQGTNLYGKSIAKTGERLFVFIKARHLDKAAYERELQTRQTVATSAAARKAESLIIPPFNLKQATLPEIVEYLRKQAKLVDPNKTGVNIILSNTHSYPRRIDVEFEGDDISVFAAVRSVASHLMMNTLQHEDSLYLEPGEVLKPAEASKFGRTSFFPFRKDWQ